MSFNQIPGDVIPNISSFLLPRDILRFRILSSFHYKIISNFLLKLKNTTDIYEHICPMCGNDWISKENNLDEYIDIDSYTHFGTFHERNRYIPLLYPTKETVREHILCDNCENIEVENPVIYNFKLIYDFGNFLNSYKLNIDYFNTFPWVCIIKETEKKVIWNQFNCYTELIDHYYVHELEDGYNEDGYNEDEYEDDENYYHEY